MIKDYASLVLRLAERYIDDCALDEAKIYIELAKNIYKKAGNNNYAVCITYLGKISSLLGDVPQSLLHYRKSFKLNKKLHTAFPNSVKGMKNLLLSYKDIGSSYEDASKPDQTLYFYREYLAADFTKLLPATSSLRNA